MQDPTQTAYFNEIKEIAREALETDEPADFIHEAVGGHQWIIYTVYNLQVLQHSSNENAYFDEYGQSPAKTDFAGLMAVLAYSAMVADVNEAMSRLRGNK